MSYQPLLVGDMTFKPASHRFIQAVILSTASMINPAFAELPFDRTENSQPSRTTSSTIIFNVSPESCLAKDKDISCINQLEFYWQLATPKLVCLETKGGKRLHCTKNKSTQGVLIDFKVKATTTFYLVDPKTQQQLARTQIMVVKNVNSDIGSKRYRHPWSIF